MCVHWFISGPSSPPAKEDTTIHMTQRMQMLCKSVSSFASGSEDPNPHTVYQAQKILWAPLPFPVSFHFICFQTAEHKRGKRDWYLYSYYGNQFRDLACCICNLGVVFFLFFPTRKWSFVIANYWSDKSVHSDLKGAFGYQDRFL